MTKLYWVIGGICMSVGLVGGIVFWKVQKDMNQADPAYIVQFIKGNIGNEDISVAIQYNQQPWIEVNTKKPLPLASTVKIIVAIAYAQQAADGRIDPQ